MRLVADAVTVRFPRLDRAVLDQAHFRVEQGETVAILGPSGSGKSTLLSVLGGIVRPTEGQVRVDPDQDSSPREVCSWILQTTNVLPERSALDNVAIAALAHGHDRRRARHEAVGLLEAVGLADRRHDPARVLSGGEMQRVVIARGLASGRPFLLADEPTGQLDADTSETVLDAMLAASTRVGRVGVVIVTHDAAVARRCERVVRIDHGQVVAA